MAKRRRRARAGGTARQKAKRPRVPARIEAEVLVQCRRRCCVCYGLDGDIRIRKGQVAHLDGDPFNNALTNLAFLCSDHHEELDAKSSQFKGLMKEEVRIYREELHGAIEKWLARRSTDFSGGET